jgi:hypothetical protein
VLPANIELVHGPGAFGSQAPRTQGNALSARQELLRNNVFATAISLATFESGLLTFTRHDLPHDRRQKQPYVASRLASTAFRPGDL